MRPPPVWSTACLDWRQRIVERRSLIGFDPLYPDEAAAALAVFKSLRIVSVPGRPTFGECARPWVFDFVAAIFGAYDAATATRRINEFLLLIAKKNIKSTVAAAIMLTALIRNWRDEAEALILAPTIEVANNSYGPAASMVRADPELGDLLHIQDNFRKITHLTTGAALKVVAANAETVGGKKAPYVLVEELHEFGKQPHAAAMLMEATGGQSAAPEGFTIYLTTQSAQQPAGVFKEKLEEFRKIRDGEILDPEKLPVLYEFPEDMLKREAYLDPANFYITNPNLDQSVRHNWLVKKLEEKQRGDKGALNVWLSKHLNVEIGLGLMTDRWAGADHWEKRADKTITLAEIIKRCVVIVVGLDGGGLDDLLGMAVLGRDENGKRLLWNRAWAHKGVLERRKGEASRLQDFERDGDLVIVQSMEKAFAEMAGLVDQVNTSGKLGGVAVDPAGVKHILTALDGIGIAEASGIPQGWKLSGAIKDVEIELSDGTLSHAGQPLMAWCVGNAKAEAKGNAVTITKQLAGAAKIDPLVATFIAEALMRENPQPQGQSIYDRPDVWGGTNAAV